MDKIGKRKVAYLCVHNSCRSQMAEAITKILASDTFDAYSAGTEIKDRINQDAVRTIKKLYGIDMEKRQHPKILAEIPEVDIAIKMGCDVACPFFPAKHTEDWGLDDPTGKSDEEFLRIAKEIEEKVLSLQYRVMHNQLPLG